MLEIKNVSKKYDGKDEKAIDNISISIEDGDIYGFIGPNGAGKSTTLKCIVGIHSYDSGSIVFNGKEVKDNEQICKQDMAYIPDNPVLYEHLSGIEFINFVANIYGVKKNRNELIHQYSKLFDIEKDLANSISSYSHGMKQKIAIIASLVHSPKLIIMDEPFVGLDPKSTYDLKEVLKKLCLETGISVFFSSHVLEVVEKFCNKVAIIKNGKIIESGLTEKIKGNETLEDKFMELFNE